MNTSVTAYCNKCCYHVICGHWRYSSSVCIVCGGTGKIRQHFYRHSDYQTTCSSFYHWEEFPSNCWTWDNCPHCDGIGMIWNAEWITGPCPVVQCNGYCELHLEHPKEHHFRRGIGLNKKRVCI